MCSSCASLLHYHHTDSDFVRITINTANSGSPAELQSEHTHCWKAPNVVQSKPLFMRPLQPLHRPATRAQGPPHMASILRTGAKPTAVKTGLLGGGGGVEGARLKDGGNGGRSVGRRSVFGVSTVLWVCVWSARQTHKYYLTCKCVCSPSESNTDRQARTHTHTHPYGLTLLIMGQAVFYRLIKLEAAHVQQDDWEQR